MNLIYTLNLITKDRKKKKQNKTKKTLVLTNVIITVCLDL